MKPEDLDNKNNKVLEELVEFIDELKKINNLYHHIAKIRQSKQ